jgi:hypothetical protein
MANLNHAMMPVDQIMQINAEQTDSPHDRP